MPERTSVTQLLQVGVETTPGTAVAANRLLPSLMLTTGIDGTFTEVRSSGYKYPSDEVVGKEWTTSKISGAPTYDEMTYLLSSVLMRPTPSTVETTGKSWEFEPSSSTEDTVATYTVEQGSPVRAGKYAYGIVTELSLKGDREKVEVSGTMMGQLYSDGITMTASPTSVPLVPMFPKEFDVFIDADSGDLGTTKMARVLAWEVSLRNRFGPLWVVDSSKTSWLSHIEQAIDASVKLTMEADAQGMGLLTAMRDSGVRFMRLQAVSPTLAGDTAEPYSMTWDFALNVKATPKEIGDKDGVYALDWEFGIIHDGTWGQAHACTLVNQTAAL